MSSPIDDSEMKEMEAARLLSYMSAMPVSSFCHLYCFSLFFVLFAPLL